MFESNFFFKFTNLTLLLQPYIFSISVKRLLEQSPRTAFSEYRHENVFQSNILSKKLQSYDCVSQSRPPSFDEIPWGLPQPAAVTWTEAAGVSPAACAPAWLPAGQQHPASRASLCSPGVMGHIQGHARSCSYPSDRCVRTPNSSTLNLVSSTLPLCTKPALLPTGTACVTCRDRTCKTWTNNLK